MCCRSEHCLGLLSTFPVYFSLCNHQIVSAHRYSRGYHVFHYHRQSCSGYYEVWVTGPLSKTVSQVSRLQLEIVKKGTWGQGGNCFPTRCLHAWEWATFSFDKHLDFLLQDNSSPSGAFLVWLFDQDGLSVSTLSRVGMRSKLYLSLPPHTDTLSLPLIFESRGK